MDRTINNLVVHCSATRASQDIGLAEIDAWHKDNGWASPSGIHCGYHYIIRRSGQVELGRPEHEIGAHVKRHNHDSIGICLIGGLDEQLQPEPNYTQEQLGALRSLLDRLLEDYPRANVMGHRDFPRVKKACPCFDVGAWYEDGAQISVKAPVKPHETHRGEIDVLPPVLPDWMRGE